MSQRLTPHFLPLCRNLQQEPSTCLNKMVISVLHKIIVSPVIFKAGPCDPGKENPKRKSGRPVKENMVRQWSINKEAPLSFLYQSGSKFIEKLLTICHLERRGCILELNQLFAGKFLFFLWQMSGLARKGGDLGNQL